MIGLGLALLLCADGHAKPRTGGIPWTCSVDAIFDAATLCKPRAEPGMRLYVSDVIAQNTTITAGVFALVSGTGLNCVTSTVVILPQTTQGSVRFVAPASTAAPAILHFSPALVVGAGQDLCGQGDPSNAVTLQVIGYTAP